MACTQIKFKKLLYCCSHDNEEMEISRDRVDTYRELEVNMEALKTSVNYALFDNDNCGLNVVDRIAFGNDTQINENPWIALIYYENIAACGGSLISDRYESTPNIKNISLIIEH